MGSLILPKSGSVYVDTSAIIYTVERHPVYLPLLTPLWSKVAAGDLGVVCSELTVLEVLVSPIRQSNQQLQSDYERVLASPNIELRPIDGSILRDAAKLRAQIPSLRTPDAIHAATSYVVGCRVFITNDRGFKQIPNLGVAVLDEV